MAHFDIKLYSNALKRPVRFEMVIPNDPREGFPFSTEKKEQPAPRTVFLLHGYTDSANCWIPEQLLAKYNLAAVMPNGENSFYLDGPSSTQKFETFVGQELPDFVKKTFRLADGSENTFILGYSMGGFGALHTGLAYPQTFGKIGAMSSALIMHEVAQMKEGSENQAANYEYYQSCFGEPSRLLGGHNNPETLVMELKAQGHRIPGIYMACGKEDFLINENRAFDKFLSENSIPHIYKESPGIHDMNYWQRTTPEILEFFCKD